MTCQRCKQTAAAYRLDADGRAYFYCAGCAMHVAAMIAERKEFGRPTGLTIEKITFDNC